MYVGRHPWCRRDLAARIIGSSARSSEKSRKHAGRLVNAGSFGEGILYVPAVPIRVRVR